MTPTSAMKLTLPEAVAALGQIVDHTKSFKLHMQNAEDTLATIVNDPNKSSGEFVKEFARRWIANAQTFGEGYARMNAAGSAARDKFNGHAQVAHTGRHQGGGGEERDRNGAHRWEGPLVSGRFQPCRGGAAPP